MECFSCLLHRVRHVLCFFYLSPQGENEGVHSNRLYRGSVMINRTNSTLTPLSISRGSITALWDAFAWTDTLVLLTLCVFICNVTENAAVISAGQTVCLCASQTDSVCKRKPLMCPHCVRVSFLICPLHTQNYIFSKSTSRLVCLYRKHFIQPLASTKRRAFLIRFKALLLIKPSKAIKLKISWLSDKLSTILTVVGLFVDCVGLFKHWFRLTGICWHTKEEVD